MSPRRGDRVTVPLPEHLWDVRFGTSNAAVGWEELCRHALANTRRCLEILRSDPGSGADHDRQHRLRGDLARHRHNGRDMEQWEYERRRRGINARAFVCDMEITMPRSARPGLAPLRLIFGPIMAR